MCDCDSEVAGASFPEVITEPQVQGERKRTSLQFSADFGQSSWVACRLSTGEVGISAERTRKRNAMMLVQGVHMGTSRSLAQY
jgi:hypothetical protein